MKRKVLICHEKTSLFLWSTVNNKNYSLHSSSLRSRCSLCRLMLGRFLLLHPEKAEAGAAGALSQKLHSSTKLSPEISEISLRNLVWTQIIFLIFLRTWTDKISKSVMILQNQPMKAWPTLRMHNRMQI